MHKNISPRLVKLEKYRAAFKEPRSATSVYERSKSKTTEGFLSGSLGSSPEYTEKPRNSLQKGNLSIKKNNN